MMEVAVTTAAIRRAKLHAKLPSNRHHQQTNTQDFYRPDAFPVTHPTASERLMESDRINITDVILFQQCHLMLNTATILGWTVSPTLAHRAVYKSIPGIFHWGGARPKGQRPRVGVGFLGREQ